MKTRSSSRRCRSRGRPGRPRRCPANGVFTTLSTGTPGNRVCIALRMSASLACASAAHRRAGAPPPAHRHGCLFHCQVALRAARPVARGLGHRWRTRKILELRLPVDEVEARVARPRYPDSLRSEKFLQPVGRELQRRHVLPARALVAPQQRVIAAIMPRLAAQSAAASSRASRKPRFTPCPARGCTLCAASPARRCAADEAAPRAAAAAGKRPLP